MCDGPAARHYVARGELKLRTGRVEAAFTDIHRAIALDRDLTNRMAWRLVATDPGERKQIEFALELALQAASARPDNGAIQNTLGVAEYRAGLLDDARTTLQTAIELSGDANYSFNAFFLAMIHQRQGDVETAREFYDKAVAWMQEHTPDNKELQQFRAEAEAVLADSTD